MSVCSKNDCTMGSMASPPVAVVSNRIHNILGYNRSNCKPFSFTHNCTVLYDIATAPQTNCLPIHRFKPFKAALATLYACARILTQMSTVFQCQHIAHVVCLVSYPEVVGMICQEQMLWKFDCLFPQKHTLITAVSFDPL